MIYSEPTAKERFLKPPAFHRLVQTAPDGRKTLYLAAHAKRIVGSSLEDSQRLIWELIDNCTQSKVGGYDGGQSHPNVWCSMPSPCNESRVVIWFGGTIGEPYAADEVATLG